MIVFLPVVMTIFILTFLINLITKPFLGIVTHILATSGIPEKFVHFSSQLIILAVLFALIFFVGLLGRWFFLNTLVRFGDQLLHKIPLVNKVYKTVQELLKTLLVTDKKSFKQVVLIPFPNEFTYSLGLVTRSSPRSCEKVIEESMLSVFIPTTPNPTTGFIVMAPSKDMISLTMTTEEAVKYIISCGVILPVEKKTSKGKRK